jgi:hypothetical protein
MRFCKRSIGEIAVKEVNVETAQQAAAAASDDRAMAGGCGCGYHLFGRNFYVVQHPVIALRAADCLQEFGPAMCVIVGPFAHVNAIDFCRVSKACAPIKIHGSKDRRVTEVVKVRMSQRPTAEISNGRINTLLPM